MTRVNVVEPARLSRQHLLAEHREITRIPNSIASGRQSVRRIDGAYRLGKGHVLFFTTRLAWLKRRYGQVHDECVRRGYNVQYRWPDDLECNGDYKVTWMDIHVNMARLVERDPGFYQFESVAA